MPCDLCACGNPGNMGICVACFSRDIAGALGLHRAAPVQVIRPEIIGFVLGSLAAALLFREFRPRTGSAPLARFLLGMAAVIGALVFLGCPWRAYLRLGGGDWSALFGIAGLLAGIVLGVAFLRRGYSLGRNHNAPAALGWLMPALMVALLLLLVFAPLFGRDAGGNPVGPIFFSTAGPGSQYALLLGQFKPGFTDQPLAHTNSLWNFGGMVLAGVVSITVAGRRVSEIGLRLDEEHGVLSRVGLHCAPAAHRTIGTFPEGAVRLAAGSSTSLQDVQQAIAAVAAVARDGSHLLGPVS